MEIHKIIDRDIIKVASVALSVGEKWQSSMTPETVRHSPRAEPVTKDPTTNEGSRWLRSHTDDYRTLSHGYSTDLNAGGTNPAYIVDKHLELNSSFEKEYFGTSEYRKSLLSYVNSRDQQERTALHVAALKSNLPAVKSLLARNTSPFLRDCGRQRPVDLATDHKVKDVLRTQMNRLAAEIRGAFLLHEYHFLQAEGAGLPKVDPQQGVGGLYCADVTE